MWLKGHLGLRPVRVGGAAFVVRGRAVTRCRRVSHDELVRPYGIDEVAQVFVVQVTG